jgi:hypothetical protein
MKWLAPIANDGNATEEAVEEIGIEALPDFSK